MDMAPDRYRFVLGGPIVMEPTPVVVATAAIPP